MRADVDVADLFVQILPKHIELSIRHNPHRGNYETVSEYLNNRTLEDPDAIRPEDREEMVRSGEIWEITWYPNTPVGSCVAYAATLQRALELANE